MGKRIETTKNTQNWSLFIIWAPLSADQDRKTKEKQLGTELNVIPLSLHAYSRDVQLTDKREKKYMLRPENIENDNLRQNGQKIKKKHPVII